MYRGKNVMQSDNDKSQKLTSKGNKDSLEKIDQYVFVSTPSIWIMLIAMLVVLIMVLIWGNIGRVPLNYTTNGIGLGENMVDENGVMLIDLDNEKVVDRYVCFVNPRGVTSDLLDEKKATVILSDGSRYTGITTTVTPSPHDYEEIEMMLENLYVCSHWALEKLELSEYSYVVDVELDQPAPYMEYGNVAKVVIELDQVHPIYYLIK